MNPRPDPERYEDLVRSCAPRVYRAALAVLARPEDAEDVTGDVFLRLLDGRLDLEDAQDPCAFLAAVGARAALQHRRGASRRRLREDRHAMDENRSVPSPDQHLDEHESREELRRELTRLPDDLRLCVALRFEGGLTYADIGTALGCAEPTAHDRVRRGLETLRRALTRAGLIALAASLEERLAASPASAPPGLEGRLLSMGSKAGAATAGLVPWLPLALGVTTAGALALAAPRWLESGNSDGGFDPAPVAAAVVPGDALEALPITASAPSDQDARRPAVTPPKEDPPAAPVPIGWVSGRVLDPERFPIADATASTPSDRHRRSCPSSARPGCWVRWTPTPAASTPASCR